MINTFALSLYDESLAIKCIVKVFFFFNYFTLPQGSDVEVVILPDVLCWTGGQYNFFFYQTTFVCHFPHLTISEKGEEKKLNVTGAKRYNRATASQPGKSGASNISTKKLPCMCPRKQGGRVKAILTMSKYEHFFLLIASLCQSDICWEMVSQRFQ